MLLKISRIAFAVVAIAGVALLTESNVNAQCCDSGVVVADSGCCNSGSARVGLFSKLRGRLASISTRSSNCCPAPAPTCCPAPATVCCAAPAPCCATPDPCACAQPRKLGSRLSSLSLRRAKCDACCGEVAQASCVSGCSACAGTTTIIESAPVEPTAEPAAEPAPETKTEPAAKPEPEKAAAAVEAAPVADDEPALEAAAEVSVEAAAE